MSRKKWQRVKERNPQKLKFFYAFLDQNCRKCDYAMGTSYKGISIIGYTQDIKHPYKKYPKYKEEIKVFITKCLFWNQALKPLVMMYYHLKCLNCGNKLIIDGKPIAAVSIDRHLRIEL